MFSFASSPGWLYPARALSGVSAGLMIGTATTALTEMLRESVARRACLVAGSAFGALVIGSLSAANRLARPETRAQVMSGYFVFAYSGLAIPVVGAGVAADHAGNFRAVLGCSIVLTLACARGRRHLRQRPRWTAASPRIRPSKMMRRYRLHSSGAGAGRFATTRTGAHISRKTSVEMTSERIPLARRITVMFILACRSRLR